MRITSCIITAYGEIDWMIIIDWNDLLANRLYLSHLFQRVSFKIVVQVLNYNILLIRKLTILSKTYNALCKTVFNDEPVYFTQSKKYVCSSVRVV